MKEINVIKKMAKLGTVRTENPFGVNKTHTVQGKVAEIKVHTQDGEAAIFIVRRLNDHSDPLTDYHAGSYYKNTKQAIEKFNELEAAQAA